MLALKGVIALTSDHSCVFLILSRRRADYRLRYAGISASFLERWKAIRTYLRFPTSRPRCARISSYSSSVSRTAVGRRERNSTVNPIRDLIIFGVHQHHLFFHGPVSFLDVDDHCPPQLPIPPTTKQYFPPYYRSLFCQRFTHAR